ncbi:hypothetical protein Acsp03_58430 [Actinomadura sp. NBRC 104412]|uniref:hypothetical protein n=1 Tax=Actinomadura sp. NBRC 104412 TaxID=3032203 RepID=UPI0024A5FCC0|nr:hypothetical protein [Actinomadura sp. NBRC 104412]GLZ08377.1 hypothetical protein Acsp03_58430 [Actinomadura sp. NBRC 104412]
MDDAHRPASGTGSAAGYGEPNSWIIVDDLDEGDASPPDPRPRRPAPERHNEGWDLAGTTWNGMRVTPPAAPSSSLAAHGGPPAPAPSAPPQPVASPAPSVPPAPPSPPASPQPAVSAPGLPTRTSRPDLGPIAVTAVVTFLAVLLVIFSVR